MTVTAVDDLIVEPQIEDVAQIARCHGWLFERVGERCFRLSSSARDGDVYQLEVDCDGFPVQPPAFHWRNPSTGNLDLPADAPRPFGFFHSSGRICAPWNRLASMPGGPHTEWVRSRWREQAETGGTTTLAAMVLRIHRELRSNQYRGRCS